MPVFIIVTKIDMCPPNVLEATMKLLFKILKSPGDAGTDVICHDSSFREGCRKVPLLVSNMDDVVVTATNFVSERYVALNCQSDVLTRLHTACAPSSKCPT